MGADTTNSITINVVYRVIFLIVMILLLAGQILLMYLWLKDDHAKHDIIYSSIFKELGLPAVALFLILLIEYFFSNWLLSFSHIISLIVLFFVILGFIYWDIIKQLIITKKRTLAIIVTLSVTIIIIMVSVNDILVKKVHLHYIYELCLILIIFIYLIKTRLYNEFVHDYVDVSSFEANYVTKVESANNRVFALNTRDYNLFFDPLGFQYFLTQSTIVQEKKLDSRRIIALPGSQGNFDNLYIINGLKGKTTLSKNQRNIHNIKILHHKYGIKLFFVPQDELINYIKELTSPLEKINLELYDNFIIDDKCYSPKINGKNFTVDIVENKYLILSIFEHFAADENSNYYVEKLENSLKYV